MSLAAGRTPRDVWRRLAWLAAYASVSAIFCAPLFDQPLAGGNGDWDQHTFYYASVLRSLAAGHLPFWNPWYCGGNVLWQNPQAALVSPVYLLALVVPLALAMKMNVWLHYLAGCVGMHLIVRRLARVQSPALVLYAVSLCVFAGGTALHVRTGHANFLPVLLLPAVTCGFFRAARGSRRGLVGGAALVGAAALNGGSHVIPLAAVLLGAFGLGALVAGRTIKPLIAAVAMVILGAAYAAPKLVPVVRFVQSAEFQDRRPSKHPDVMSAAMIGRALWDGSQGTDLKMSPGVQKYGWHEYGNYLGWFGATASVAAAAWVLAFRRRRDDWQAASAAIALVVALVMAAGEFASWAPATLVRALPFFSSFRIPSRHILLVPLAGAVCVAFAAAAFELRVRSVMARRLVELLCVVGVCQLVWVNREAFRDVFVMPLASQETRTLDMRAPAVTEREPPDAGLSRLGENSNLVRTMIEGVSPLNCYEQVMVRRTARPGPAAIAAGVGAAVSGEVFAPNRVSATVIVGSQPSRATLNQNAAAGWSSPTGPIERDPDTGTPSVSLPAGYAGEVTFDYVPPGLWAGLAVAAAALALSVLMLRSATPGLKPRGS